MKRDLYAEVSARIVAELERGAAPWVAYMEGLNDRAELRADQWRLRFRAGYGDACRVMLRSLEPAEQCELTRLTESAPASF